MRNFLNDVLGVRPRSKEFLIWVSVNIVIVLVGSQQQKLDFNHSGCYWAGILGKHICPYPYCIVDLIAEKF